MDRAIDSYSGFFDNDHRLSTGMGEYLQSRGVTEVDVMGLATDYCVRFTALDARKLGFKTSLIRSGVGSGASIRGYRASDPRDGGGGRCHPLIKLLAG